MDIGEQKPVRVVPEPIEVPKPAPEPEPVKAPVPA